MDARTIVPTDEQQAIIEHVKTKGCANLLVRAYAGTGKTTILEMIQNASKTKPMLCLAFNKRIAVEMEKRFQSSTAVRTFNGLGHRIWAQAVGNLRLNTDKSKELFRAAQDEYSGEDRKAIGDAYFEIIGGVAKAKALGYVPEGKFPTAKPLLDRREFHRSLDDRPSPIVAEVLDSILVASIKAAYSGYIDFNDQIYMPAVFGGTFPRFPAVVVDEYQDLNPTNIAMLKKLVTGWVGAVGDDFQCIYGFRGARSGALDEFREFFKATEKTISITFRCPQKVVEAARFRVPEYKWVRTGGSVERLLFLAADKIPDGATILCRNNAPLFRAAFGLLASTRSVKVAGSDIGPKIVRMLTKLGGEEDSKDKVLSAITVWRDKKLETSQAPTTIHDMADCMRVFANFGTTLGQAIAYANHLFAQQGTINMMTIHKSKGGEWDHVYLLDPYLIGDDDQELNLRYVAITRAKESFSEIDSKNTEW